MTAEAAPISAKEEVAMASKLRPRRPGDRP